MRYLYGEFSDKQVKINANHLHNKIHKLLLYKDKNIKDIIFNTNEEFNSYFLNLLFYIGGLNKILGEPKEMMSLMSVLQTAYNETQNESFSYKVYRKLILDAHGFIKSMFDGGCVNAETRNS